MTLHSEMQLGKALSEIKDLREVIGIKDFILNRYQDEVDKLTEFLHRFIHAANSHVELEPFVVEGEELLRSIEE